jgi:hypothetical protein
MEEADKMAKRRYTKEEMSRMSPRELRNAQNELISGIFHSVGEFFANRKRAKEEKERLERERIEQENRRQRRLFIIKIAMIVAVISIVSITIALLVTRTEIFNGMGRNISILLGTIGDFFMNIYKVIKNFFVYIFVVIKEFFMKIPNWIRSLSDLFKK